LFVFLLYFSIKSSFSSVMFPLYIVPLMATGSIYVAIALFVKLIVNVLFYISILSGCVVYRTTMNTRNNIIKMIIKTSLIINAYFSYALMNTRLNIRHTK
jgi:hypothetical protein